jgi:hypothetical protein
MLKTSYPVGGGISAATTNTKDDDRDDESEDSSCDRKKRRIANVGSRLKTLYDDDESDDSSCDRKKRRKSNMGSRLKTIYYFFPNDCDSEQEDAPATPDLSTCRNSNEVIELLDSDSEEEDNAASDDDSNSAPLTASQRLAVDLDVNRATIAVQWQELKVDSDIPRSCPSAWCIRRLL